MSTRPHSLIVLLTVLVLAGGARASEPPATIVIDPEAERIVRAVAAHYRAFDHGRVDIAVSVRGEGGDAGIKYDIAYALDLARPARFALRPRRGTDGGTIVSDGRTLTVLAPGGGHFVQRRAPRALSTVLTSVPDIAVVSAAGGMELDVLFGLLGSVPEKRLLDSVSSVRHEGVELIDAVAADHLCFTQGGVDVHLWFQQGPEPWLVRLRPDLTSVMKTREANAAASAPAITLTVNYRQWTTTPPDAKRFVFVPPATAQRVKSFLPALAAASPEAPRANTPVAPPALREAPAVTLELLEGGSRELAARRGRIVVIDFWATWCVPCVSSMSALARIDRDYRDRGVELYMVNMSETEERVAAFMRRRGFAFRVALDRDGSVSRAFGVHSIPHTVIIDPEGRIHTEHTVLGSNHEDTLRRDIETLLARQAAAGS
ncbi:MAG: redoxin domain-containing protein [Planctomycetes bacterium]|nr:redoxin domain-containing protein [Planctomycetota bacterium]